MRFAADGPSIPNELIEARDRGEVIFFCGAGISIPAGLPSFYKLTENILTDLGVPNDALGRRILRRAYEEQDPDLKPPMDQVIGALQREYGSLQVERSVRRQLKATKHLDLSFHRTILSLSRNPSGKHRLVTTNFDSLFEKAKPRLKYHVPPFLPDLTGGIGMEGIVYLHGRLSNVASSTSSNNLILGAGDYGRAYLAEGWAVNFLRELFNQYTVVLIGYSADDPPVNYLLRGLKTIDKPRQRRIYAFAAGQVGEAEIRWWDRGVQVITYAQSGSDHSALWNTLSAWAARAENPETWRSRLVEKAKALGPANLHPHERGQIAAMVSTFEGAKAFLASSPPPAGEWLCVFDANLRYAKPTKPIWLNKDEIPFDPLETYRLDDDPTRELQKSRNGSQRTGVNLLTANETDTREEEALRPLAGHFSAWPSHLPKRLNVFADWLRVVSHESITAWWAAGSGGMHPTVRRGFRFALKQEPNQMSRPIRKFWLLFLGLKFDPQNPGDEEWYDLLSEIRRNGWTQSAVREFSKLVLPTMSIERPVYLGSRPPAKALDLHLREIASFSVEYRANRVEIPPVPDEVLPQIVQALRNGLLCSSNFLEETEESYVRTNTLHREELPGQLHLYKGNAYLRWFADSFERLCGLDIALAKHEILFWPKSERHFFDKLKIWSWYRHDLVDTSDVISGILNMTTEEFWESNHRREMLWALRARWDDFPGYEKSKIVKRIIEGPPRRGEETDVEFSKRTSERIAAWLGWLKLNSCALPDDAETEYQRLRDNIDGWRDSWAASTDHSLDGRSGWVRPNDDPKALENLPISEIAKVVLEIDRRPALQFVENVPFSGLVKKHVQRAALALSYELKMGRAPEELWRTLMADWPENAPPRALWLTAHRLMMISADQIVAMRYECSRWIHKVFASIIQRDSFFGWRVWDFVFEAFACAGAQATESGIGEIAVGGVVQERSRRTVNHAINGPIGELAAAVIDLLIDSSPASNSGLPEPVRGRFQRLLGAPGEGSDHATILLCERLDWLESIDPDWIKEHILPLFQIGGSKAEAAWNGFLSANRMPPAALFRKLKFNFLATFSMVDKWIWDNSLSRLLSSFLIAAVFSGKKVNSLITYEEARNALRIVDDEGRGAALRQIETDPKNATKFFRNVWPKERRFQTGRTSEEIMRMAIHSGELFPRIINSAVEFIVPVGNLASELFSLTNNQSHNDSSLYRRFPKETIRLLDAAFDSSSTRVPFELSRIVGWISEHHPYLREEPAWIRLNNVIRNT